MIRVMVVDSSAVVRSVLQCILEESPDISVMAVAPDPVFALAKMERQWPDAIITAAEMPRMDGITFVRGVMSLRPTPILVCANFSQPGLARQLLEAGAADVIPRPMLDTTGFLRARRHELVAILRSAVLAHRKNSGKHISAGRNPGELPAQSGKTVPTLSKFCDVESL
jgi:two-component system, chemotaxis family, protein-glutamate methylesterase/glutaminase